jgi:hypothetical protein
MACNFFALKELETLRDNPPQSALTAQYLIRVLVARLGIEHSVFATDFPPDIYYIVANAMVSNLLLDAYILART